MNHSFTQQERVMQRPDVMDKRPRETQRANILEAARRVFARKGKAATMADVAEAAGVSQGLAYRYFASKEQIYRELLDQVLSSDKPPDDFAELIRQRRESFLAEFRQLIVEGQATGEVAAGDPDQLLIAITASLEGLVRFGLHHPEQFHRLCPDASILLRML